MLTNDDHESTLLALGRRSGARCVLARFDDGTTIRIDNQDRWLDYAGESGASRDYPRGALRIGGGVRAAVGCFSSLRDVVAFAARVIGSGGQRGTRRHIRVLRVRER